MTFMAKLQRKKKALGLTGGVSNESNEALLTRKPFQRCSAVWK